MQEGTKGTWMDHEIDRYFKGRKRLAEMMDVDDPESLSDDDIAVSVYIYMERFNNVTCWTSCVLHGSVVISCDCRMLLVTFCQHV